MKDYLIINRAKWNHAGIPAVVSGSTELLNDKGFMCCLGFRCHQMGIPKKDLLNQYAPEDIADKYIIPGLVTNNGYRSNLSDIAININDGPNLSNEQREQKLIELFAKHGITVEFTGKYPKL